MAKQVTLEQLTEALSLEDIVFIDFSALRKSFGVEKDSRPATEESAEVPPKLNIQPALVDDGTRLGLLVTAAVPTPEVIINVRLELRYAVNPPIAEVPDDVMGEFLSRSAVFTATPYVREFVQSSAVRLRVPAPLLQLGRPIPMSKDESSDGDADG